MKGDSKGLVWEKAVWKVVVLDRQPLCICYLVEVYDVSHSWYADFHDAPQWEVPHVQDNSLSFGAAVLEEPRVEDCSAGLYEGREVVFAGVRVCLVRQDHEVAVGIAFVEWHDVAEDTIHCSVSLTKTVILNSRKSHACYS